MGIFGTNKSGDRLNLNNLDVENRPAKMEYSQVHPLADEKDRIYKELEDLNEWVVEHDFPSLIQNGKWSTLSIAYFAEQVFDHATILSDELRKAQELTRKAREENARLKHYLKQLDGLEGYAKWLKAQKQGRKPKEIDFQKYELLKKAGVNQKDIAKLLGVSPNTLRKILKATGRAT